eukprot:scaffold21790_cov152-Isochrysis_galbana.AAC.1
MSTAFPLPRLSSIVAPCAAATTAGVLSHLLARSVAWFPLCFGWRELKWLHATYTLQKSTTCRTFKAIASTSKIKAVGPSIRQGGCSFVWHTCAPRPRLFGGAGWEA